jgi:hypothetical protein
VSLRLLKRRQLKSGGFGLVRGAYPLAAGRGTLVRVLLAWVTEEIARLTEVIDQLLAPYEEQLQQAGSMPGSFRCVLRTQALRSGGCRARHPR